MPTYEYRCESCTHQFEVFARMSDPDPEVCEACGEHTLTKVLFPVAVHYKGSGFYNTDYGSKKTPASADTSSSSSESSGGDSSGDSTSSSGDSTKQSGDAGGSPTPAKSSDSGSPSSSSGSSNDG